MSHRTIADAHGATPKRSSAHQQRILIAMSVAVAMTFLDQTIVALAVPDMQHDRQGPDRIERTLTGHGVPGAQASQAAHSMIIGGGDLGGRGVHSGPAARAILDAIQIDIAHAVQTVTSIMAGIMAIAFAVAMLCLRGDSPKLSVERGRGARDRRASSTA